MSLTIKQAVQMLYDDYAEISDDDLLLLEEFVQDELDTLNPGFESNALTKFTACLMLDNWVNRPGTGPVTEEKTKNTMYKSKIITSSYYRDKALQMVADFKSKENENMSLDAKCSRSDSELPELSEHEFTDYTENE